MKMHKPSRVTPERLKQKLIAAIERRTDAVSAALVLEVAPLGDSKAVEAAIAKALNKLVDDAVAEVAPKQ